MTNKIFSKKALVMGAVGAVLMGSSLSASAAIHFQQYVLLPAGGTHIWTYICPTGQKMVTGGFDSIDGGGYSSNGLRLTESYPSAPDTWKWRIYNQGPGLAQYRVVYTCTSASL